MIRAARAKKQARVEADEIDTGFKPLIAGDTGVGFIDGQAVLFDGRTGNAHLLNQSGAILVSNFDGERTLDEIAADVATQVGVSTEVVTGDVLTLTRGLGAAGVLEGVAPTRQTSRDRGLGLAPDTELPPFAAVTELGERVDAWQPVAGAQTMLVNWSPTCSFCTRVAPGLARMTETAGVGLVLVSTVDPHEVHTHARSVGLRDAQVLSVDSVPPLFSGIGTPAAYLIGPDGRVATPIAIGAIEVGALVEQLIVGA